MNHVPKSCEFLQILSQILANPHESFSKVLRILANPIPKSRESSQILSQALPNQSGIVTINVIFGAKPQSDHIAVYIDSNKWVPESPYVSGRTAILDFFCGFLFRISFLNRAKVIPCTMILIHSILKYVFIKIELVLTW